MSTARKRPAVPPNPDPLASAELAGLRYTTDARPGLIRERRGEGFVYRDAQGKAVRDPAALARVKALAIPPAWSDVWVCDRADGHLQATGRDEKGRKQYRYHPRWRATRDESKFGRMMAFGAALPKIRERVERDLGKPGLPREKVLATLVRLLEVTLIRVGNEEYARANSSFGLTTMRDRHVAVEGSGRAVRFGFVGKSGVRHTIDLRDPKLARVVRQCRDLPGQELFQYLDEAGERRSVDSADVNDYLREVAGDAFTAKDFRTWAGTVLAALALREFEAFDSKAQGRKNVVRAIERVAERLGNTPTVCRKCYVHPEIINAYLEGSDAIGTLKQVADQELAGSLATLRPEEAAVLALLQQRLSQASQAQGQEPSGRSRSKRGEGAPQASSKTKGARSRRSSQPKR